VGSVKAGRGSRDRAKRPMEWERLFVKGVWRSLWGSVGGRLLKLLLGGL